MALPWKEGPKLKRPAVDINGVLVKHELPLGRARTLAELTGEFTFFTPAVLYITAMLNDTPLIDFQYEINRNVDFFYKKFDVRLFDGLEVGNDPSWCYALWAMRKDDWKDFLPFYGSIAVMPATRAGGLCLRRVGWRELRIVDPLAVRHVTHGSCLMTATAFGVNADAFRVGLMPANIGSPSFLPRPRLLRVDGADETRKFLREIEEKL